MMIVAVVLILASTYLPPGHKLRERHVLTTAEQQRKLNFYAFGTFPSASKKNVTSLNVFARHHRHRCCCSCCGCCSCCHWHRAHPKRPDGAQPPAALVSAPEGCARRDSRPRTRRERLRPCLQPRQGELEAPGVAPRPGSETECGRGYGPGLGSMLGSVGSYVGSAAGEPWQK